MASLANDVNMVGDMAEDMKTFTKILVILIKDSHNYHSLKERVKSISKIFDYAILNSSFWFEMMKNKGFRRTMKKKLELFSSERGEYFSKYLIPLGVRCKQPTLNGHICKNLPKEDGFCGTHVRYISKREKKIKYHLPIIPDLQKIVLSYI